MGQRLSTYVRNPGLDYWDNYGGQNVVVYNEFYNSRKGQDLTEMNDIYSNTAYVLPMASLAEKGSLFCSLFVIMLSNNPDPPTEVETMFDTGHMQRRRDFNIKCDAPGISDAIRENGGKDLPATHKFWKEDFSHMSLEEIAQRVEHRVGTGQTTNIFQLVDRMHALAQLRIDEYSVHLKELEQQPNWNKLRETLAAKISSEKEHVCAGLGEKIQAAMAARNVNFGGVTIPKEDHHSPVKLTPEAVSETWAEYFSSRSKPSEEKKKDIWSSFFNSPVSFSDLERQEKLICHICKDPVFICCFRCAQPVCEIHRKCNCLENQTIPPGCVDLYKTVTNSQNTYAPFVISGPPGTGKSTMLERMRDLAIHQDDFDVFCAYGEEILNVDDNWSHKMLLLDEASLTPASAKRFLDIAHRAADAQILKGCIIIATINPLTFASNCGAESQRLEAFERRCSFIDFEFRIKNVFTRTKYKPCDVVMDRDNYDKYVRMRCSGPEFEINEEFKIIHPVAFPSHFFRMYKPRQTREPDVYELMEIDDFESDYAVGFNEATWSRAEQQIIRCVCTGQVGDLMGLYRDVRVRGNILAIGALTKAIFSCTDQAIMCAEDVASRTNVLNLDAMFVRIQNARLIVPDWKEKSITLQFGANCWLLCISERGRLYVFKQRGQQYVPVNQVHFAELVNAQATLIEGVVTAEHNFEDFAVKTIAETFRNAYNLIPSKVKLFVESVWFLINMGGAITTVGDSVMKFRKANMKHICNEKTSPTGSEERGGARQNVPSYKMRQKSRWMRTGKKKQNQETSPTTGEERGDARWHGPKIRKAKPVRFLRNKRNHALFNDYHEREPEFVSNTRINKGYSIQERFADAGHCKESGIDYPPAIAEQIEKLIDEGCTDPKKFQPYNKIEFPISSDDGIEQQANDPNARELIEQLSNKYVSLHDSVTGTFLCWATGIHENWIMTVGHVVTERDIYGVIKSTGEKVEIIDEVLLEGRDLALLQISGNHRFRSIIKHFRKRLDVSRCEKKEAFFIYPSRREDSKCVYLKQCRINALVEAEIAGTGRYTGNQEMWELTGNLSGYNIDVPLETSAGDCGSLIVIVDPRLPRKILSMHKAGDPRCGYGVPIYQEDLMEFFEIEIKEQSVVLPHHAFNPLAEPFPLGVASHIIGFSDSTEPQSTKTEMNRSPFAVDQSDKIDWIGDDFEPVILSRDDSRLIGKDIDILAGQMKWDRISPIKTVGKLTEEEKRVIIDECVEELIDCDMQILKGNNFEQEIRVLTKTEAINRCEGLDHAKQLNRKASAGYYWNKRVKSVGKNGFLKFDEQNLIHRIDCTKPAGKELNDAIDFDIARFKKGKKIVPVFHMKQKDEVRTLDRTRVTPKTRTFATCQLDMVIAYRMYFGAAISLIVEGGVNLGHAMGVDPLTHKWDLMTRYLLGKGNKFIPGDYKDYDANHFPEFLDILLLLSNRIYKEFDPNWKPEDDLVRENLYHSLNEAGLLIEGTIIRFPGGVYSGRPDTTTVNCLLNRLYRLFCWKVAAKFDSRIQGDYGTKRRLVGEVCLGDDFLESTGIPGSYNLVVIERILREELGIIVTDPNAKDTGEMKPYYDITEVDFLHRNFLRVGDRWCGRLSEDSFDKMLNWTRGPHYLFDPEDPKKIVHVDPDALHGLVTVILSEVVLYGRTRYNDMRDHITICLRNIGFPLESAMPTYRNMCHSFDLHPDIPENRVTTKKDDLVPDAFVVEQNRRAKRDIDLIPEKEWTKYGNRKTIFLSDEVPHYEYGGKKHKSFPLPMGIAQMLRLGNARFGVEWNGIVVNSYQEGQDMPFHCDDEKLDGPLGIYTLLGSGEIEFKKHGTFLIDERTLFIDRTLKYLTPHRTRNKGKRISLSFRHHL
nr:MAG: nonstructural protein [Riboviria sp.]